MDSDRPRYDSKGLTFFGRIAASVSHDLKNVLAIVNENAGLLGDLARMAEKGLVLDPVRVKTVAGKIADQVSRADGIVKNMNRFAHSVDHPRQQVMLNQMMDLMMGLYHRTAVMRSVTITLNTAEDAGSIMASPFELLHLLWVCLDRFTDTAASGSSVDIRCERTAGGVRVRYRLTGGSINQAPGSSVSEQAANLASSLRGRIALNSKGDQLDVMLPVDGG